MPVKHGNKPVPLPPITADDIERFRAKVNTEPGQGPKGECHAFMGARTPRGYGVFEFPPRISTRAHRVAYYIHNEKDPFPNLVLHTCDWPPCVRGEHLFTGDATANGIDASKKGRLATGDRNGSRLYPERLKRGSENGISHLTEEIVVAIRVEFAAGIPATQLAKKYATAHSNICQILKGKAWIHAGGPIVKGDLVMRGDKHVGAELNAEKVKKMRLLKADGMYYREIADLFGVSLYTAYAAITRKTWKTVE